MTAEFDPLRDDVTDYALRLVAAGIPVDFRSFAGMFHGFNIVRKAWLARYALDDQILAISRMIETAARAQPAVALAAATAVKIGKQSSARSERC